MKYHGKSKEVCNKIIEQFETGNVPKALSQIFVIRSDDIPSQKWSWNNRFVQAVNGTYDSRGFRQWQKVGRKVSKGSKALYILGPCIGKKKDKDGNEVPVVYGFKSIPVFAIESTEVSDKELWGKHTALDAAEENRLDEMPLKQVADDWNIKVNSFNGKGGKYLGYYSYNGTIALGTQNLATWCHELIHAADHKNGTITIKSGQQPDNEVVAELGGAAILQLLGFETESDLGGAWEYIKSYSGNDKSKAVSICCKLLDRICNCINIILEAYDNVNIKKAA